MQEPLHLRGADLKLQFSGQDMAQLMPLTGIPLAKTPPYRLTGQLDFQGGHVQFRNFAGHMGRSDLEGTIDVNPGKPVLVNAELRSNQVDLADLGGLIGAEPGHVATPGQTPEKRAQVAAARASPGLLPTKPISSSELHFANVRLRYRGEHILGDSIPLDNLVVVLDMTMARSTCIRSASASAPAASKATSRWRLWRTNRCMPRRTSISIGWT